MVWQSYTRVEMENKQENPNFLLKNRELSFFSHKSTFYALSLSRANVYG